MKKYQLLVLILLLANGPAPGVTVAPELSVGGYQLVQTTRVTRTVFDFTYTAKLTNTGGAVRNAAATVTSTDPNTVVLDNTLTFGDVPAGATVVSSDTFAIRHNRIAPFDAAALVWTVRADPVPVTTAVPNVVGLHQSDAEREIVAVRLRVGAVTKVNSDAVQKDHVIEQTPDADTRVEEGTAVDLRVSLGPASVGEGRLRLNEIVFNPSAVQPALIEVKNVGAGPARLSDFEFRNGAGGSYRPPDGLTLPPEGIAAVLFDGGNRVDGLTVHATDAALLTADSGSLALIDGTGAEVDRVAWGDARGAVTQSYTGVALKNNPGGSVGRPAFSAGLDPFEWTVFYPGEVSPGLGNPNPRVRTLLPLDGAVLSRDAAVLRWYPSLGAVQYRIQVAADEAFLDVLVERTTADPVASVTTLTDGVYFWRVQPIMQDGSAAAYSDSNELRVRSAEAPALARMSLLATTPIVKKLSGFPSIAQFKDTELLALERPEFGDHSWNLSHGALDTKDPLDNSYCVAASVAMVAGYYGGTVSQDRIRYESFGKQAAGPEDDFGYNQGIKYAGPGDGISQSITFALGLSAIAGKRIFNDLGQLNNIWEFLITQEIDQGRPLLMGVPGHMVVITGYEDDGVKRMYWVHDPWSPNSADALNYAVDLARLGVRLLRGDDIVIWNLNTGITGRSDEAGVSTDSDGDGVMDFDETERFRTDPSHPDTDRDKVGDLQDIRASVFDDTFPYKHGITSRFDADSDGLPMELDRDSDDDHCPDGYEDANRNGAYDKDFGETYNYDPDTQACRLQGTITLDGRLVLITPGGTVTRTGKVVTEVTFDIDLDLSDSVTGLRVFRPSAGVAKWTESVTTTFPCSGTANGEYSVTPADGTVTITKTSFSAALLNFGLRFIPVFCNNGDSFIDLTTFTIGWFSTEGVRPILPPDTPGFPKTYADTATFRLVDGQNVEERTWTWSLTTK